MPRATVGRRTAQLRRKPWIAKRAMRLAAAGIDQAAEGQSDPLLDARVAARLRVRSAEAELAQAQSFARSQDDAWSRLCAIIHQSRNLAAAGDKAGREERRLLLDCWCWT